MRVCARLLIFARCLRFAPRYDITPTFVFFITDFRYFDAADSRFIDAADTPFLFRHCFLSLIFSHTPPGFRFRFIDTTPPLSSAGRHYFFRRCYWLSLIIAFHYFLQLFLSLHFHH
jgi:hypothetical protein